VRRFTRAAPPFSLSSSLPPLLCSA
jgi:hypothetical protein